MHDLERLACLKRHRCPHVHVVLRISRLGSGLLHHQLGLRHDGRELAIAAGDAGLPDRGGAAAVQRRAFGLCHVALGNAGEEIGLALDRGGRATRCGRLAVAAVPPRLSAKAIRAPPCMTRLRLVRFSVTRSSAVTRSGETWVIFMPMKAANGGCSSGFISKLRLDLSFMPSGLPQSTAGRKPFRGELEVFAGQAMTGTQDLVSDVGASLAEQGRQQACALDRNESSSWAAISSTGMPLKSGRGRRSTAAWSAQDRASERARLPQQQRPADVGAIGIAERDRLRQAIGARARARSGQALRCAAQDRQGPRRRRARGGKSA